METRSKLLDLADLFKMFAEGSRIRILYLLNDQSLSVGEIAEALNMTDSAVSHQLQLLRQAKLVKYEKQGRSVIYTLADDHVKTIIENGLEHVNE